MSYINRFTFKHTIGFRLLERGFEYLTKIQKVTIDGNLVHAYIQGNELYDITCLIDFINRRLIFPKCSCPYAAEHRHCKHMAALQLYLDLYINGGSVYELENFYIAEAIVNVLNNYDRLNIYPSVSNLFNSIVNKSIHSFDESKHITLYSPALLKIEEKRFDEALRFLLRNKIVKQSRNQIILIKNEIHTSYYYFFAKYSFMMGKEKNENYYLDFYGNYDESFGTYYYSLKTKEKHDGIDIITLSRLLKEDSIINLYLDLENKTILDEFDIEDDSHFDRKNNIIPKIKLSNDFMAFIINTIEDSVRKNELLDEFEDNKLISSNFINAIPDNPKYKNAIDNYYIGKLLEICLLGNIWIDLPRPYNSNDYDFEY